MRIGYLFFIVFLLASCQKASQADIRKSLQEVTYDGVKFPEPKFDEAPEDIIEEIKNKYDAKQAIIGRSIRYSSKEDYDYWLKVELLNPEISNKEFKEFGKEAALEVLGHLTNDKDFKKIEISTITKKGFIITFTTRQNIFFDLDSLQQPPGH